MTRQRQRPIRRRGPSVHVAPASAAARSERTSTLPGVRPARRVPRAGWRGTIESFGGFVTIGVLLAAVVAVVVIVVVNRPESTAAPSEEALMGEAIDIGDAPHVNDPARLVIPPGQPPVGGPMFNATQREGVYEAAVPDGSVIHSLEHGMVWISYRADMIDTGAIDQLREIAKKYDNDVILSPRPENEMPIALASWGRLQRLDSVDGQQIERFINTNRNRSPETMRGAGSTSTR